MNQQRIRLFIGWSLLYLSSKGQAAPRIEILSNGKSVAVVGALRGALQVQADLTTLDVRTGKMTLKGNVVLSSKDATGHTTTLRAAEATLSSAEAEFQIVDKVLVSFDDGTSAYSNRAQLEGNIELYVESTLQNALRQHPGFESYRLRYSGVGAGADTSGTLLFDQEHQLLKVHEFFSYPEAKLFHLDDRIFLSVTSTILERAFEAAKKKKVSRIFDNLPLYGCQLIDRSR